MKIELSKDELNNIIDSLKGTTQLFLDDDNEFDRLILKLEEFSIKLSNGDITYE